MFLFFQTAFTPIQCTTQKSARMNNGNDARVSEKLLTTDTFELGKFDSYKVFRRFKSGWKKVEDISSHGGRIRGKKKLCGHAHKGIYEFRATRWNSSCRACIGATGMRPFVTRRTRRLTNSRFFERTSRGKLENNGFARVQLITFPPTVLFQTVLKFPSRVPWETIIYLSEVIPHKKLWMLIIWAENEWALF